jgi:hypothetical protein
VQDLSDWHFPCESFLSLAFFVRNDPDHVASAVLDSIAELDPGVPEDGVPAAPHPVSLDPGSILQRVPNLFR